MKSNKPLSWKSWLKSFAYAFHGLRTFFLTERNALVHVFAALLIVCIGNYAGINAGEWCFVAIAIGLVFIAEIFNTAVERLTDMVSPEYNEKAGKVKDMAAGGVVIASVTALVIGTIIFIWR